jgi:hypothetical protein
MLVSTMVLDLELTLVTTLEYHVSTENHLHLGILQFLVPCHSNLSWSQGVGELGVPRPTGQYHIFEGGWVSRFVWETLLG